MGATRQTTTFPVIQWVKAHPDILFSIPEVASDLRLRPGSVGTTLLRLAEDPNFPLEKKEIRGTYIYHSNGIKPTNDSRPPTPEMYEAVGITTTGEKIVRDEKGILWKLSGQL